MQHQKHEASRAILCSSAQQAVARHQALTAGPHRWNSMKLMRSMPPLSSLSRLTRSWCWCAVDVVSGAEFNGQVWQAVAEWRIHQAPAQHAAIITCVLKIWKRSISPRLCPPALTTSCR